MLSLPLKLHFIVTDIVFSIKLDWWTWIYNENVTEI